MPMNVDVDAYTQPYTLTRPRSYNIPTAMYAPSTWTVASKYALSTKKNQFFGETCDARSGIRKAQNVPRIPCYPRKCSRMIGTCQKDRCQDKGGPTDLIRTTEHEHK